jgi:allantoin racemase
MRIAIIGSGTAAKTLPAPLAELAAESGDEAVLVDPRLSAFALSAYERLIVDLGYVDAIQSSVAQAADAILINSFADYGIDAARAVSRQPIIGAGEATLRAASNHGRRPFAIVTVWPASMGFLYTERLRSLELTDLCRSVQHVSPEAELQKLGSGDDVMQRMARHDEVIFARVLEACERAVHDGAAAIALGCTCMLPIGPALATCMTVPVFEASRTGLQAALAAARHDSRSTPSAIQSTLVPQIVSAWAGTIEPATITHTAGDCPVCIEGDSA